ncbi:MAG: hypothetical protein DVB31_01990 [Verrucomicrobia bacterium]|nr:MAG: hypothetical protein DVB31_01990 [Verrucomicrobiota bacterium]
MNPRRCCGQLASLLAIAATFVVSAADTVRISRTIPASLCRYTGRIADKSASKRFDVPWSDGEIASVSLDGGPRRYVKWWKPSDDGKSVRVAMDWVRGGEPPAVLTIESIPATGQTPDGRWSFRTADATTTNAGPNAARIHEWTFEAMRPGNYTVEITGGAWDERTEAVEVELCGQVRPGQLDFTGGRNRSSSKAIGRMRIPGPGRQRLRVQVGESNRNVQGMLTAIVLRPAPEGVVPRPDGSGVHALRVADAALAGASLTVLGWGDTAEVTGWTEEAAQLEWTCRDIAPGHYRVELSVRAGTDASGDLEVRALGQTLRAPLRPGLDSARVLGEIEVTDPGNRDVTVRPRGARGSWSVSGLKLVRVQP